MSVQEAFRRAFLKYLLDPDKNESVFIDACIELFNSAHSTAKKNAKGKIGTDEIYAEIEPLVKEAIRGICITETQSENIQQIQSNEFMKNKEKAFLLDSVLEPVIATLKEEERIVDNKHQKVFAALYPIELDGLRLKNSWFEPSRKAGDAALVLSKSLMHTTLGVCKKDSLVETDQAEYAQAYKNAEGHGIDKHRGLKEKFQNFCIALSCVFIFPIFIYASQDSFWSTAKTKTQEDVDNSHDVINEYKQSFKHQ